MHTLQEKSFIRFACQLPKFQGNVSVLIQVKPWCQTGEKPVFEPMSMMTSSNENFFRVTGPLCGGFTGHR